MSLAIVVGATGGIGSACVERLARKHTCVLAVSRRPLPGGLAQLGNVVWQPADLSDSAQREVLMTKIGEIDEPVAALVIASGVAHRAPVDAASAEDWDSVLGTNVSGPAALISAMVGRSNWANPAGLVVIGSLSARCALPDRSLYGASKAAIEHYARCIAVELAPRGIFVNVLSVGVTDTPFLEGDRSRLERYVAERIPTGRMIDPVEVAEAVDAVLAFRGAMVGATIELDGGAGVLG